jgi:hypothetical protein
LSTSASPGQHPDSSRPTTVETLSPSVAIQPQPSPAWGFVDLDPPASAADFVRSGEAYSLILSEEWLRIWVGAGDTTPAAGRILLVRTPMVNGARDTTQERATMMDLPLHGTPLMILGVLDSGSLAIQSGDGTGKRVGLDLKTFALVPVDTAPIRIDCGLLGATECRGVMEAIVEVADNVNAVVLPSVGSGVACASGPPSTFVVSVVLRSGEGDPTRVLTCVRRSSSESVRCE